MGLDVDGDGAGGGGEIEEVVEGVAAADGLGGFVARVGAVYGRVAGKWRLVEVVAAVVVPPARGVCAGL